MKPLIDNVSVYGLDDSVKAALSIARNAVGMRAKV